MVTKSISAFFKSMLIGIVLCVSAGSASAQSTDESPLDDLVIMTESYPPFNFETDGELQGISTDIMVELMKRTGSTKSGKDIELLPWARGYKLALSHPKHALYSTTRTPSREKLFKWVGPFVPTVIGVIAKKESALKVNKLEDLYDPRVGVVKDDIGHLLLAETNMPKENIEPVLMNDQNYKKLFAGRVDAIAYGTYVANWQISELGQNPSDYQVLYELKRSDLYLALHLDTPDDVIGKLQTALDEIKADGTYQAILDKYLKAK